MVAHIGGVAAFPIPEGYTLYVADDSIGNGDTATDDIVADANNAAAEKAAAEKALADEPYNAGYSSTCACPSPFCGSYTSLAHSPTAVCWRK